MEYYSIKNLSVRYGQDRRDTIQNITVDIPTEGITALIGPSGCGKSTFIQALMNIIPSHIKAKKTGSFLFGDRQIDQILLNQMSTEIGYVFQNPDTQFCTYRVYDELAFSLENLNYKPEDIKIIVEDTMALLDITHLQNKVLYELSGGEKQKVAIASVLVTNPPFLIFDEPTANMDIENTDQFFELIHKICIEQKKTILIIEHKLEHLWKYLNYFMILNEKGQLDYYGDKKGAFDYFMKKSHALILPPIITLAKALGIHDMSFDHHQAVAYLKKLKRKKNRIFKNHKVIDDFAIQVNHITLQKDSQTILDNISFDVEKGDFIGLVGKNGAGKSSLMNCILGIDKDMRGSVSILGKKGKATKKIALCFQNPEWQFICSSVYDEVAYGLKKQKIKKKQLELQVQDILSRFHLIHQSKQNPFTLSEGEKRRLSVAAVTTSHQKILILDEPTFGLDGKTQREVMTLLKELNEEGITIVVISHNVDEVYQYCNRIVELESGKIAFDGKYDHYFSGQKRQPFWYQLSKQYEEETGDSLCLRCIGDLYENFII